MISLENGGYWRIGKDVVFGKVIVPGLLSPNKNVGIAFLLYYSRSPNITQDEGSPKEWPNCEAANTALAPGEFTPFSKFSL